MFVWYFWIVIFENVDISLDVCNKCSVTPRELFKNIHISYVFLILLNCDVRKCWYFVRRSQKNGASFSVAANLGYEIPAHLYSLLKPTRTLIAKAIGRALTKNMWNHYVCWYLWNADFRKEWKSLSYFLTCVSVTPTWFFTKSINFICVFDTVEMHTFEKSENPYRIRHVSACHSKTIWIPCVLILLNCDVR